MANDKLDQILAKAQKHPEYDHDKATAEAGVLEELELVDDLFVRFLNSHDNQFKGNKWGSWLSYYSGITSYKPKSEKFHLQKRRTYARDGWPDIDMDFCKFRRHEIVDYLFDKYGRDRVGNIGVVQTLKLKNSIRRAIKVLDVMNVVRFEKGKQTAGKSENYAFEQQIMATLPDYMKRDDGSMINTIKEAYEEFPDFRSYMDEYPIIYKTAQELERQHVIQGYGCLSLDTPVLTEKGNVRIDQVDPKDCALAYVDITKTIRYTVNFFPHKTGIKKCYKMRLLNGDVVKITDEHLVFTDQGLTLFEKIRKNPKKYKVFCLKK